VVAVNREDDEAVTGHLDDRMNATAAAWRNQLAAVGRRLVAEANAAVPLGDNSAAACAARSAEQERRRAEIAERRAVELEQARADWTALRDRLTDNPPALAVLELHQPDTHHWVCCATCYDGDERAEWECGTYVAIKEAAG
jgi:hypothetical protein